MSGGGGEGIKNYEHSLYLGGETCWIKPVMSLTRGQYKLVYNFER